MLPSSNSTISVLQKPTKPKTKRQAVLNIWTSYLVVASLFFFARTAFSQSVSDQVRLEIRTKMSSDRQDIQGSSADTKTQRVTISISLTGKMKTPESRVVHWVIYGKDLRTNAVTKIDSGEQPLALDSSGRQILESKPAETTSTPDHAVVSRGRRGKASVTKVDGSGVKYLGYGVVVKDGAVVVGQTFNPRHLEDEFAK